MDAIVAVYQDWGIGAEGTQPVALSADRRYFREKTRNAWVIVGRNTLADFPGGRPLPNRVNLVLTRGTWEIPGAQVVHSPEEALRAADGQESVFVIGGASVYRAMLPFCSRVYVTHVGACPSRMCSSPIWTRTRTGSVPTWGPCAGRGRFPTAFACTPGVPPARSDVGSAQFSIFVEHTIWTNENP